MSESHEAKVKTLLGISLNWELSSIFFGRSTGRILNFYDENVLGW